jgi:hypothetical protein
VLELAVRNASERYFRWAGLFKLISSVCCWAFGIILVSWRL